MRRVLKSLLIIIGGVVALLLIATVGIALFFDPNDYRENIAAEVKSTLGRELVIEGDIELSVFPWLAIEIGRTRLGNAAGFGEQPFASFEQARLSVRLLPLVFGGNLRVGTAELDSLQLNLAINKDGRSNWQDFIDAADAAETAPASDTEASDASVALEISGIEVRNASLDYSDAQTGDQYRISNVNMVSGQVSLSEPIPLSGALSFELQPAGVSGNIEMQTVVTFDTDASIIRLDDLTIDGLLEGVTEVPTTLQFDTASFEVNTAVESIALDKVEMSMLGLDISAVVEPF